MGAARLLLLSRGWLGRGKISESSLVRLRICSRRTACTITNDNDLR